MNSPVIFFGLAFGVFTIALLVGLVFCISRIGQRCHLAAEVQRKLVHVGIGLFALTLPFFLDRVSFAVFALVGFIALMILRLPRMQRNVSHSVHAVTRKSWGDILLLVAVSVLFFLGQGDALLYTLPLAIITLSDACAALIGTQYGQRKFGSRDREKSLEGTIVFFLVTWMVTVTILILTPSMARDTILTLATLIAAFTALVEASSWRGLDNLFVPIGLYALLAFYPQNPLQQLVLAVLFMVILILSALSSRLFGLTRHACRSLAICLFLTIGLSSLFHALFALGAMVAYISLRRHVMDAEGQDLEFVLVLTLMGIFWLVGGNLTGRDAISFYMMHCATLLAGLSSVHVAGRTATLRFAAAVGVGLIVWFAYRHLIIFETALPFPALTVEMIAAAALMVTLATTFLITPPLRHMPYRTALPAGVICALAFFIVNVHENR